MSTRTQDLAHVEGRIRDLGQEARQVQTTFQTYSTEVHGAIRELLEKAGIWDEVNSLEQERAQAAKRAEDKIKVLNEEAVGLQKVRSFLLGREQMDPSLEESPKDEEPAEEGAPEPDEAVAEHDGDSEGEAEAPETTEEAEPEAAPERPSPPSF